MSDTVSEAVGTFPRRTLAAPIAGMTAGLIAMLALVYTGDYLFFTAPPMKQVFTSVKVPGTPTYDFVSMYGVRLWIVIAIVTPGALILAVRRPGRGSTIAMNALSCVLASGLVYLVHQAAWGPTINLILNVTDPGNEVPRWK